MKYFSLLSLALAFVCIPALYTAEPVTATASAQDKTTSDTTTKEATPSKKKSKKAAKKSKKDKSADKGLVKATGSREISQTDKASAKTIELIKPRKETMIILTLEKDQLDKPFAIGLWEKGGATWSLDKRPDGLKFIGTKKGKETARGTSHKWVIAATKKGIYELTFRKTYPLSKKIEQLKGGKTKTSIKTYKIIVP